MQVLYFLFGFNIWFGFDSEHLTSETTLNILLQNKNLAHIIIVTWNIINITGVQSIWHTKLIKTITNITI